MTRKVQYWARYEVNLNPFIREIWDVLDNEIPDHYERELNPHLTVHPRFQFASEESETFRHYVYDTFPSNINAQLDGFYYHPNKYQPMVICLDVSTEIPFTDLQQELTNKISRNGGKNVIDTAPPHITVYKSNDKTSGRRKIPSNVNQIKTRCRKLGESIFPISVSSAELQVGSVPI